MAFNPNDDRFYDSLNKSGDQYRGDRYRVAEDQAATSREIGQMYGELPQKTLKNGMDAADWRQKREMRNQEFQGHEAEQKRAEENQGFERTRQGRVGEEWGIRKPMLQNDATQSNLSTQKAQMEADYRNQDVGAEESGKLGYSGDQPLTRGQAQLMRGDQGDQLGLDTTKQNLANSKAQANAIAQQIAITRQHAQDEHYDRAALMAANDLQDVLSIKDPAIQGPALEDWRTRNSKLIPREVLSNMYAGGANKREAALSQGQANRVAETKLIYGPAIQEAQTMTAKLAATQELAENARIYDQNSNFGGAYENPAAEDARRKAGDALDNLRNHQAADHVRNAHFAGARGVLSTQAQNQAASTLSEFNTWYARQDDKVKELPEVKRAFQQAQQLQDQSQSPSGQGMRKVPSLVGGGGGAGGGQNTQANRSFLTGGGAPAAGQGYGAPLQQQPPTAAGFQLGNIALPGRPAPQQQQPMGAGQVPQGPGQAPGQAPGQIPGQDPYGLMKSSKPRATPAGVAGQGGYFGSR